MLIRQSQIAFGIQTDESTPVTLASADAAGSSRDHSHDYAFEFYERGITRATLASQGSLPGGRMATIKATDELVGGNADIATDAPWHRRLRSMGFSVTQLKKFNIGARSGGEFKPGMLVGDNATYASSTKTARVAYLQDNAGTDVIVLLPITGTFASSDTVYDSTGVISGTLSSAAANAGAAFAPVTETDAAVPACATVERRMGGEIHRIESARGKGSLTLEWSKPALLAWELSGPVKLNATTGRPTAASALATPAAVGTTPMVMLNSIATIGAYSAVMTKLEVGIDNTIANRKTIGSDAVLSSGYQPTKITGRKVTFKVDPEYLISSTFDIIGRAALGTTAEIVAQLGSEGNANGRLIVWAGAAQITENPSMGDRDGVAIADVTFTCTGTADDELFFFHVFI